MFSEHIFPYAAKDEPSSKVSGTVPRVVDVVGDYLDEEYLPMEGMGSSGEPELLEPQDAMVPEDTTVSAVLEDTTASVDPQLGRGHRQQRRSVLLND